MIRQNAAAAGLPGARFHLMNGPGNLLSEATETLVGLILPAATESSKKSRQRQGGGTEGWAGPARIGRSRRAGYSVSVGFLCLVGLGRRRCVVRHRDGCRGWFADR